MCLHSSRADAVKSRLINKHGTQEKINLHVKCASSLQGEMYDVVIMSALSTDNKKFVHDQHIISTITQARFVHRIVVKFDLAINFTTVTKYSGHNYILQILPMDTGLSS